MRRAVRRDRRRAETWTTGSCSRRWTGARSRCSSRRGSWSAWRWRRSARRCRRTRSPRRPRGPASVSTPSTTARSSNNCSARARWKSECARSRSRSRSSFDEQWSLAYALTSTSLVSGFVLVYAHFENPRLFIGLAALCCARTNESPDWFWIELFKAFHISIYRTIIWTYKYNYYISSIVYLLVIHVRSTLVLYFSQKF